MLFLSFLIDGDIIDHFQNHLIKHKPIEQKHYRQKNQIFKGIEEHFITILVQSNCSHYDILRTYLFNNFFKLFKHGEDK